MLFFARQCGLIPDTWEGTEPPAPIARSPEKILLNVQESVDKAEDAWAPDSVLHNLCFCSVNVGRVDPCVSFE